ncbi:hypothetical protein [Amycolatopsis sp. NPDC004625]|uniref:hypothetical protein n=1 Tax=Amycolatopsis sp. NPDC004625 TaxID=3154670 RepID=UPI0033AB9A19
MPAELATRHPTGPGWEVRYRNTGPGGGALGSGFQGHRAERGPAIRPGRDPVVAADREDHPLCPVPAGAPVS